jgi:hypothetical protein
MVGLVDVEEGPSFRKDGAVSSSGRYDFYWTHPGQSQIVCYQNKYRAKGEKEKKKTEEETLQ